MAAMPEHKVVMIGDYNVGKTSMFLRYKTGKFPEDIDERVKRDMEVKKKIMVDGELVEVNSNNNTSYNLEAFVNMVVIWDFNLP